MRTFPFWLIATLALASLSLLAVMNGSVPLSMGDFVWKGEGQNLATEVLYNQRIPTLITTLAIGVALPLSGFLLQELFQNPLAGPSVLGVSSAAGLGVAVLIFLGSAGTYFSSIDSSWQLSMSAFTASLLAVSLVLFIANRIKNLAALLVIGFMLAGFCSAIISLLQFFSSSVQIQRYVIWGFGALSALDWSQVLFLSVGSALGFLISYLFVARGLEAFKLGGEQVSNFGVSYTRTKWMVVIIAAWLAAISTAFVGPIAFIGLAVPYLVRLLFPFLSVRELMARTAICGACVLCAFLNISKLFGDLLLPINIVASFFGAPFILVVLYKSVRE